jgi:hypothetical protein
VFAARAEDLPGAVRFVNASSRFSRLIVAAATAGGKEGNRTLDEFASDEAMLGNTDLWWAVLKNLRSGVMPPAGEEKPTPEERKKVFDWIKFDVFRIDPANPDPGRVTVRRLNRTEYRNTVRDLTGVDYNTTEFFPVDDSGYGSTIWRRLSVSPLLMEKYCRRPKDRDQAVPKVSRVVFERQIGGRGFRERGATFAATDERSAGGRPRTFKAEHDGKYRLSSTELNGEFEFDPARIG